MILEFKNFDYKDISIRKFTNKVINFINKVSENEDKYTNTKTKTVETATTINIIVFQDYGNAKYQNFRVVIGYNGTLFINETNKLLSTIKEYIQYEISNKLETLDNDKFYIDENINKINFSFKRFLIFKDSEKFGL